MTTRRKTEYFCDGCEKQVEKNGDLTRAFLGTKSSYRSIGFDLCLACRGILSGALPAFVTDHLRWTEPEEDG